MEVAFRKHTCYIRNLQGVDLLKGSRGSNLYTMSLEDMMLSSPICHLSKALKTKSWLWHRRLSHLNFNYITTLAKQELVCGLPRLNLRRSLMFRMCSRPMRIQSINGRKYVLVIVDDYSRFTWVKFLRSKDDVPEFVIKFLKMIQVRLNMIVQNIQTNNGTKFVNQTLRAYYEDVGISHQISVARSPQQNDVVKRQNRTLVEVARTMLIFSKAPLFLWAEAVATACFIQNQSLIRKRYKKTPYELLHNKKPDLSYFHVFGALCYPTNDTEDLSKLKSKADIGIFVGYAPAKKVFRIYNKRTRLTTKTIHVDFEELTSMASEQFSSGPGPQLLAPGTLSSKLVPNLPPSTPVASLVPAVAAPVPADLTNSPSSTPVDQDAPYPSTSQTPQESQSLVASP
ncbi:retrovirus-related pol polyprotein from transposon TNT 1-94, partial [Tanacetum coccineum]